MIIKIFYEIILLALSIVSSKINEGTFELESDNNVISIKYSKISIGDEESAVLEYNVTIYDQDNSSDIVFKMVDNGLYKVTIDHEEPFTLDMAPYFKQLDWSTLGKKRERIIDSLKKTLNIIPGKESVVLKSKAQSIEIIIPKEYFNK